jgi:hypothetical protein
MKLFILLSLIVSSFSSLSSLANEQFLARVDAFEKSGTLYKSNEIIIETDSLNRLRKIYQVDYPNNPIEFRHLITKNNQIKKKKLKLLFITLLEIRAKNFSLANGGDLEIHIPKNFKTNNVKPISLTLKYDKNAKRWQALSNNKIIQTLNLQLDKDMEGASFLSVLFNPPKVSTSKKIMLSCENKDQYLEDTNDLYSVEKLNCK